MDMTFLSASVLRLIRSWKGISGASLNDKGSFGERKNLGNIEGKIAADYTLCNVDHAADERENALSFRGGLFAVFCAASSCCAESSVAEGIMHSIIPCIAECGTDTLSLPSIAGFTPYDISWINTLRFQELLTQACTCPSAFQPSPELNNGITLPSSAVASLRLLLEGFERGIVDKDNISLAFPSVLHHLEQLLLHSSIQKALCWAEVRCVFCNV